MEDFKRNQLLATYVSKEEKEFIYKVIRTQTKLSISSFILDAVFTKLQSLISNPDIEYIESAYRNREHKGGGQWTYPEFEIIDQRALSHYKPRI